MMQKYEALLNETCYQHAEEHLGETVTRRNAGIAEIQQWLQNEQPNITLPSDVRYIVYFLRTTKFDVTKTKRKIQM